MTVLVDDALRSVSDTETSLNQMK